MEESPYDAFGTGHSSTSISAALGYAMAAAMRKTNEKVVAVIGDGSMTAGLAYEGLNNAGKQCRYAGDPERQQDVHRTQCGRTAQFTS